MSSPRVLVVDSDPSSLGLLTRGMTRFGLAPAGARDAAQAMTLVGEGRPDVVVSEVNDGAGLQLLEQLRGDPATKDIPVLLIAKGAWARRRSRVRELGAQALVAKPAFVQDIAVLTWLYAGRLATDEWFEGNFGEPSCPALLRGLLAGGRSGTLRLEPSDALVRFKDGVIIDAQLPPLSGERALLRILTLGTGSYDLTFETQLTPGNMQFELSDLATRGLPHVRMWEQLKGEIQPLEQVLTVDFERFSALVETLPRGLFDLVRLFDGKRNIGEVIAASALDDLTAGQAIAKLRALDVFEQGSRHRWEADTPSLGRPTPVGQFDEVTPVFAAPATELPPLAEAESAALQLTPAMADAHLQADQATALEHAFFSGQAEEVTAEVARATVWPRVDRVRTALWALVGVSLLASGVLLTHAKPPVAAVATPSVVAAAPGPGPGLSVASKQFDRFMSDGAVAYDKQDFKTALLAFQAARALDPQEASAALAVGSSQYELGKLDAATEALSNAISLDPANGRAEILLGAIAQERGQKHSAREHYQSYLSIDPDGEHAREVRELISTLGR